MKNKNLIIAASAGIFLVVATLLIVIFVSNNNNSVVKDSSAAEVTTTVNPIQATGKYYTTGNTIVDPQGKKFVAKGTSTLYSSFMILDDDGCYGLAQLDNYKNTFKALNENGVNLIRIFVQRDIYIQKGQQRSSATNPPKQGENIFDKTCNTEYTGLYDKIFRVGNNYRTYMDKLDEVIHIATSKGSNAYVKGEDQKYNFVVEIANAYTQLEAPETRDFLTELASKYKDNPNVWIQPGNEPWCAVGAGYVPKHYDYTEDRDPEYIMEQCEEGAGSFTDGVNKGKNKAWTWWSTETSKLVQTIRDAGNTNPVVVNGIEYSWNLSKIDDPLYELKDKNNAKFTNVIYAAHRYGNKKIELSATEKQEIVDAWANKSKKLPIIVDEVGAHNSSEDYKFNSNQLGWVTGFTNYVLDWTNTQCGAGMVVYTDVWSDGNRIMGVEFNPDQGSTYNDPTKVYSTTFTKWGNVFLNNFVKKVNPSTSCIVTSTPTTSTNPITTSNVAKSTTAPSTTIVATSTPASQVVLNSDFEANSTGWSGKDATVAVATDQKYAGSKSLKATSRAAGYAGPRYILKPTQLVKNGNYNFEVWVRSNGTEQDFQATIQLTNTQNEVEYIKLTNNTKSTNNWVRIAGDTGITWEGTLKSAEIYIETNKINTKETKADFYIDNAKFTKK